MLPYIIDAEREKALRYKFDADKIRSIVGSILIRSVAAEAFPNKDIVIARTEEGKPYLEGKSGFEFSLSHSGDLIALATDSLPIGVDVEQVKDKDWRIFHRYLTDAEMSMIENADEPEAKFFDVWTVREALSKEEGLGLRILDRDFSVDYESHIISYEGRSLFFRTESYQSSERYSISLCSPTNPDGAELIYLTKVDWEDMVSVVSALSTPSL